MKQFYQALAIFMLLLVGSVGLTACLSAEYAPDGMQPQAAAIPMVAADASVLGIIQNADGPVEGATVRVQATDNATLSQADGTFILSGLTAGTTVTVTASASGHYIGWVAVAPGPAPVTIQLNQHFVGDNYEYEWAEEDGLQGSASCGQCHTAYAEWLNDGHSQSATNIRFLSMYAGTDIHGNKSPPPQKNNVGIPLPPQEGEVYHGPGFKLDFPTISGNCATCHTPLAGKMANAQNCGWSGCHQDSTAAFAGEMLEPGVSPLQLTGDAAEGISCEFCHKVGQVYLEPATGLPYTDRPGILSLRLYRPAEGHDLIFGPLDDIARSDIPEPRDVYSPLQSESEYCSGCHYGILGGVVVGNMQTTGGVLVYSSYREWLESPYSDEATGQTCQDCHMRAGDTEFFAWPTKGGVIRDPEQVHNHDMLTTEMIQNAAMLTATARLDGNMLQVDVRVTNDATGHHVPTDSPLRHVMLIVDAVDRDGRPLELASGSQLPAWAGNYADRPGRVFAKVLRDEWTGEMPTGAIWRPVEIVADTRIPALASDESTYQFPVPVQGDMAVHIKLVYRTAYQQLMEWKQWDDPDIVMREMTITVPSAESMSASAP